MANAVLVIGESGSGKSTSLRNLNPEETFIYNVANKPLPFRGWKSKYKYEGDFQNMSKHSNPDSLFKSLKAVLEINPKIKNIVIDDFQYLMAFEYMNKADVKGFDKFVKLAKQMYDIIKHAVVEMPDDIFIVFLSHAEESVDIDGKRKVKAKTIGKMIDNALTIEGLFSIVLYSRVKKDIQGNVSYVFETRNNGENTCKSPEGMFESPEIPNDLSLVKEAIYKYENE
jgi:energy-coupling factor transporter ATP-binding protein EcfA2